jgi:hypothetical protein
MSYFGAHGDITRPGRLEGNSIADATIGGIQTHADQYDDCRDGSSS